MRNFFIKNLSLIILCVLLALTVIFGFLYFTYDKNERIATTLGGVFVGLFIAVIQHLIYIDEKIKMDKIKALNVKTVLFNRANEDFYRKILSNAKDEIKIMGVTGSRFIHDFANTNSTSEGHKVLITALTQNVKVFILLPNKSYLKEHQNIEAFEETRNKMTDLSKMFPSNFFFRYFEHEPAHSIFWVDGDSIIGPVIPKLSSKDTPGIHIANNSPFAKVYQKYFEDEWENSKPI